jgi:acetyltransferase-like isoleucine patch superfamily enzyme
MKTTTVLPHDWFPQPLPPNVIMGERSWCYSSFSCLHYRSRRSCGVRIGHDSGIYAGSFFDLGPEGEVDIGNFVTLVGVIICSNSRVVIRDFAFLAHEVVLADQFAAKPYPETTHIPRGLGSPRTGIVVGVNSWIGARAVLLAGASIGEGAIVGAFAVVDFDVPPFAIVAGNPARVVGWAKPAQQESEKEIMEGALYESNKE